MSDVDANARASTTASIESVPRQGRRIFLLLKDAIAGSTGRFASIVAMSVATALLESAALILLPAMLGGKSGNAFPWRIFAIESQGWPALFALYFVLVAAAAILVYAQSVASSRLTLAFAERLRTRLHAAIMRAAWGSSALERPADLVHTLMAEATQCAHATQTAINLATRLIYLPSLLVAALVLSPRLALAALALAALAGLPMLSLARRAYASAKAMARAAKRFHGDLADEFAGLRTIKMLQAESARRAALQTRLAEMRDATLAQTRATAGVQGWQRLAAAVTAAGGAFYGLSVLHLDGAAMLALTIALARIAMNLSQALDMWRQLGRLLPVYDQLRACEEKCRAAAEPGVTEPAPPLREALCLRGIGFTYPRTPAPTLVDINLTIPACSITALTGPSGSGKSTLADIIMGLLAPTRGDIFVDGLRLDGEARVAWRSNVAHVAQEPFLFHDTVRANLLLADPKAQDAELETALAAADAEFVLRLPHGLDTIVGDRGNHLSGGERQRLMLARALLRRPDLLVLDEATNALDPESEANVIASLCRLASRLTILVIAHRSAMIEAADRVLVLDRGTISARDQRAKRTDRATPLPRAATGV